jgi:hypothetical protein
MKNQIFLLIIFLFTILSGCEEDIIPVPPVVIDPVVSGTAYALPTSILAGETTTITYTGSKDVISVTINGTTVSATSGSKAYTLTSTTTFTVKFVGPNNKTDEESVTVNVTEPPVVIPTKRDTIINLLCSGSFKKVKLERKINDVWDELTMPEKETRRLLIFTKDGKYKDYDPLGINLTFEGSYTISNDLIYLIFMGQENEIITLTDKQLVLVYWSQGTDPITNQWVIKYCQIKETYDRVK